MATLIASRLCRTSGLRLIANNTAKGYIQSAVVRNYARDTRQTIARTRGRSIKETLLAPAGDGAFNIGKGVVAGASLMGIGALAFYGMGLSNEAGAIDRTAIWPKYVKERIQTTYLYFGSSLAITAAAAMAAFRSPAIMNLVASNGMMGMVISLAAIIGTGMVAQSIEYKEGFGMKQMAWITHAAVMGAMLAPMMYLGGPILTRAAWYTMGVVGGLSTIAVCAPSEKFLSMGAPLAMGLGVVFMSSIATMFLPPTTALGAGLYSISLYGGLVLFSGFLLYDTQRIIAQAERYPPAPALYGVRPYDPINAAISIYMDTLNIFIRIATIMAGGGGGNRK